MIPLLPLAHAGHVLVDLAMFSPVLLLAGWFVFVAIRDKRADRKSEQ